MSVRNYSKTGVKKSTGRRYLSKIAANPRNTVKILYNKRYEFTAQICYWASWVYVPACAVAFDRDCYNERDDHGPRHRKALVER